MGQLRHLGQGVGRGGRRRVGLLLILGVDPGSIRTGYGAVATDGRRHELVEAGVLSPPSGSTLPERLHFIHQGVARLLDRLRPETVAVEDVFHAVNTHTALVLGHVRGVVLLAGAQAGLSVHAFAPATVKEQITGFGRADKQQVAMMVARILGLPGPGKPGDSADALAVALCCAAQLRTPALLAAEATVVGPRRRRTPR